MDRKKAQQWGSDLIRTRISRQNFSLEKRTWTDLHFWEWIFIIFALLSIAISIGFSIFHLVVALIDKQKFIFPILVILNNLFSAYFLWNGVMEELPFKILLQLVIKCIIWIFDLMFFLITEIPDESEVRTQVREIRFYISSAMLFLTVITGGFVVYQYWTSHMSIFRSVGTVPKYVRLCRMWNFSQSMMLFDAVAFITVLFHLCDFPYFILSYATYYLLPTWLIATVCYVAVGMNAIDRENRMLTYIFYVASHFQPIFVIFMLAKATKESLGTLLFLSLYVTSLLSLLAHVGLLISVVRVQNSYGMGLKEAAEREAERKQLVMWSDTADRNGTGNEIQLRQLNERKYHPPPTETEL